MKNVRVERYSGPLPPGPGFYQGEESDGDYTWYRGVDIVARSQGTNAYRVAYDLDGPGDVDAPTLAALVDAIRSVDPNF